jgi:ribose 5-phosphate isomerase RpiB
MQSLDSQLKFTKVFIGNDHAAYDMKVMIAEYLRSKQVPVEDQGF